MKVVSEDDSEICNGIKTTDSLAVTGKSGYTVYYSMEFINYNIDLGSVQDSFRFDIKSIMLYFLTV